MFSQKLLVVVVSCFCQIFVPLSGTAGATSQCAVLRSGRRMAPERRTLRVLASRRVRGGASCRVRAVPLALLEVAVPSLPALPEVVMGTAGQWLGTLPVVTGISGPIQAAPSKKGFSFVLKKIIFLDAQSLENHFWSPVW